MRNLSFFIHQFAVLVWVRSFLLSNPVQRGSFRSFLVSNPVQRGVFGSFLPSNPVQRGSFGSFFLPAVCRDLSWGHFCLKILCEGVFLGHFSFLQRAGNLLWVVFALKTWKAELIDLNIGVWERIARESERFFREINFVLLKKEI